METQSIFSKERFIDSVWYQLRNNLANYRELGEKILLAFLIIFAGWIIAKIIQVVVKLILRLMFLLM